MKNLVFLMSCFLLMLSTALADEAINLRIHQPYLSPRIMGMGGAFIAVADDYNALYHNPAGLARLEHWQMNFSTEVALTTDFFKLVSDIDKASIEGSESDEIENISKILKNVYGSHYMLRSSPLAGTWVWPRWGIGFIPMDLTIDLSAHQQAFPAINAVAYADSTLAFGYGKDFPWFRNARYSMGVTGKIINRAFMSKSLSALDFKENTSFFRSEDAKEGLTADFDIGMLYTPDLPHTGILSWFRHARPTFGAVVRNVLDYGYSSKLNLFKDSGDNPERLYRTLDLGSRWEYPSFWVFQPRGVLDIKNIGHPHSTRFLKMVHLGWELGWKMYSWWKGSYQIGLNQGYLTAGLSARFAFFNLDLVTYGEDVGTKNKAKENRIWMIKLNIEL